MKRVFKIINKLDNTIIFEILIRNILVSFVPFAMIFIMSEAIEGLVKKQEIDKIMFNICLWFVIVLLVKIVCSFMNTRIEYKKFLCIYKFESLASEHTIKLDYELLQKEYIQELRTKVMTDRNMGWGMGGFFWLYEKVSMDISSLFIAIVIIVPMINRYKTISIYMFLLILAIIFFMMIYFKIRNKANMYEMKSLDKVAKFEKFCMFYSSDVSYKAGKDIRIYNAKDMIDSKGKEIYKNARKILCQDVANKKSFSDGFSGAIVGFSKGMAYLIVVLYATKKNVSCAELITYAGTINQLATAILAIGVDINEWKVHISRLISTLDYIEIESGNNEVSKTKNNKENINVSEDKIELRNVSFKYPNSDEYVLKNINLLLNKKYHYAVVGENGSGKTTFINLLCKLYRATEGKILLNDENIYEIDDMDYIKKIAVVSQNFKLLANSIASNIAISNDNIENNSMLKEKIISSMKKASIYNRIANTECGIQTAITKELYGNGVEFSGGEMQKIAIARALFKESSIVILDEPTAALDPLSEEIYINFDEISKEKMTIFVSHRLASCKHADQIIVFDKGQIIQKGTHEELLCDKNGKYSKMWQAQVQYYIQK